MSTPRDEAVKMFVLALGAGMLGAAVALLYAPQAGEKTRRDLRRAGENLANEAEDLCDDLTERLEGLVKSVEAAGGRGLEQGKQASDKIRGNLLRRLETSKAVLSEQIKRVENLRKVS